MRKRVWSIFIVVLLVGGLLPAVTTLPSTRQIMKDGRPAQDSLAVAVQLLPTLEPSQITSPTITYTVTLTPLQPVPPTPTATRTPTHTPTNPPRPDPTLPPSAKIDGIYGYWQLLPLSCESRSAADWARHFGIEIHELDFLNRIPKSSNPEEGFVGSVYGGWGNTPPGPYGVHAEPVAKVLREYGAKARALKGMSFAALQYELASGRPVMIWVTGHTVPGNGIPYEVGGNTITVAPYEHTVIAIGYDEENDRMLLLDGKETYWRSYETFRASWGALENMAVVWDE